ncbi:MAG: enoyl-CoA hydratase/isomerase family protein [Chitinophagaceae bacterium]
MIHEVSNGYVKVETHYGITTIEFFHPQGNSLPAKILEDLELEIHSAATDEATKVIILRSGGEKTFCAGASLDELVVIKNAKDGQAFFSGIANLINAMRKCPKLIIGRIQGNCVGGGVGLAAAVDYCIAWEKVDIKLSELSIGIAPFVVGPAIERKIGSSAFSQLLIDATMWRNADWAKRKGLFAEVHPFVENMDESVSRLADTLVRYNPEAMSEMKKIMWRGTEDWDTLLHERAALSGRLVLSEYTKNAIVKFKSKVSG